MKKIMTLVMALFFTVALSAENLETSALNSETNTKEMFDETIPVSKDLCRTYVAVDCDGDGVYDYEIIVDCEYADVMIQQFIDAC